MKRTLNILLLLFTIGLSVSAQKVHQGFQNVAPSPQSYAFAQYAEMPVSLFTGTPSISIPLFTISCGQYSMPISLNYHASGIKVMQEASWVGLGWNLNAGGSITRSVRGMDDLLGGYLDQDAIIPPIWEDYDADIVAFELTSGYEVRPVLQVDAEPDVFYYNFLGYSGKFYTKNRGAYAADGHAFYLANPDDNLKIEFDMATEFKITTPDGTIAIFTLSETSQAYGVSYDETRGAMKEPILIPHNLYGASTMTEWKLSKIIFPNKEEINFEYTYEPFPFRPTINTVEYYYNPVMRFFKKLECEYSYGTLAKILLNVLCFFIPPPSCSTSGPYTDFLSPKWQTSYQANIVEGQCYLKGIRWRSGHIRFETSERKDFCSLHNTNELGLCPKLDKMLIYRNHDSTPFREFIFHETYFSNPKEPEDSANLRLKLDSVSICADTVRDVYKFAYDTRHALPPKYSFTQDLWGYYNGIKNAMLYPRVEVSRDYIYTTADNNTILAYRKGQVLDGAGREPNPEYITTAMLTEIESPEGAVTTYTYEPNEGETKITSEKVYTGKELYQKAFSQEVKEYMVHLPEKGCIKLNYKYNGNVADPKSDLYKNELVSLKSVNGLISTKYGIDDFADLSHYDYSITREIECPAGDYKFTLRSSNYLKQEAELLFYKYPQGPAPVYGGGVRIAKIVSPLSTREYIYRDDTDSNSSGVFIRTPYHETSQITASPKDPTGASCDAYVIQQSSPVFPLESPMSNTAIGYRKVKIITRSSNRVTEEDFYYSATKEKVNLMYSGMPGECIYMNGKLLKHTVYVNGKLLQKDENTYEEFVLDSLNALYQDHNNLGIILLYKEPIVHCRLKNAISETYDPVTSAVNRSETSYSYNSLNYLPATITVQNGSDKRVTKTTYPVDLKNSSATYNEMCGYNLITNPIEVRTYENGVLSRKELYTYKKHPSHPAFVPAMNYSYSYGSSRPAIDFNGNNASSYGPADIIYSQYDDCHNRLEVKTRTGQCAVYLWGYNRQYPIAQIFNATLSEVQATGITDPKAFASGNTPTVAEWELLHALRSRLPKASVSVFQYDPLVGVTVSTDPRGINTYYEYDAMGRLVTKRDHEHTIIQTYHYTLKNER